MREDRSALKPLICKPAGKRRLRMPRRRLEDNIRIDPKEIDVITRNWINFAQKSIIGYLLRIWHWSSLLLKSSSKLVIVRHWNYSIPRLYLRKDRYVSQNLIPVQGWIQCTCHTLFKQDVSEIFTLRAKDCMTSCYIINDLLQSVQQW